MRTSCEVVDMCWSGRQVRSEGEVVPARSRSVGGRPGWRWSGAWAKVLLIAQARAGRARHAVSYVRNASERLRAALRTRAPGLTRVRGARRRRYEVLVNGVRQG